MLRISKRHAFSFIWGKAVKMTVDPYSRYTKNTVILVLNRQQSRYSTVAYRKTVKSRSKAISAGNFYFRERRPSA